MKKFFFLLLLSASTFIISAQGTKSTKELLLDTICGCLNAKKADLKNASSNDLQKAVMVCFMSDIELLMKYAKEEKVDINDEAAMEKLGQTLGFELLKSCPMVMELALNMAMTGEDKKSDTTYMKPLVPKPAKIEMTNYIEGTVIRLNTTSFPASIEIKQKDGTLKKIFLVSSYYAQEDKFYDTEHLPGKKVGVQTEVQEIFNPSSKKFEKFNVVIIISSPPH